MKIGNTHSKKMMIDSKFTIIIPTLAVRHKELERAIDSVLGQSGGQVVPLVVVNGDRFDSEFVQHLRQKSDIRFHQNAEPGVSRARYKGRNLVDTPYFGFLDDDDEYLPDAISIMYRQFNTHPETDVVVANGWHDVSGTNQIVWQDTETIAADPTDALMDENWLSSCGAIYKSETIGPEFFDFDFPYLEWTHLALNLALTRKISFVPEPTYIIYDTLNSVSDSDAYMEAHPKMLNIMLDFKLPPLIRNKLVKKLSATHHNLSEHYLRRGENAAAWKCHLRSMASIHGVLRYGLYTRRLFTIS